MKKKTTKKSQKKHKGPTLMDRLPKNEGERIELMIKLTQKANRTGTDQFLLDQEKRLKVALQEWRINNT